MIITGFKRLNRIGAGITRMQNQLPIKAGGIAVDFYKGSFRRQGWIEGGALQKWKSRKEFPGKRTGRGRRALMIKTGRLRRSIRITAHSRTTVRIGTDVPYAQIHNEGGKIKQTITITPKMRKFFWAMFYETDDLKWKYLALKRDPITREMAIPKRQFMGPSDFLMRRIIAQLEKEIETIFKTA